MSDIIVFAVPILIGLVAAGLGWHTICRRAHTGFAIWTGLAVLVSGGLFVAAQAASGWDGIPYMIAMILGALPATAGLLLGGGVGLMTRPQLTLPS